MYKLILSVNNLEEVMVWPSVPPDFGPEQAQRNGTYEGISGDFNTLGPMGLWSIPLSGVFPVGRRLDGGGVCRFNAACSVDEFEWKVKRNGDIAYSLTFREYRFL